MSRPKVPEDKRKRVANACEFCRTRKQKCNGQTPCSLCIRKDKAANCKYDPSQRKAPTSSKSQHASDESAPSPGAPITPPDSASPPDEQNVRPGASAAVAAASPAGFCSQSASPSYAPGAMAPPAAPAQAAAGSSVFSPPNYAFMASSPPVYPMNPNASSASTPYSSDASAPSPAVFTPAAATPGTPHGLAGPESMEDPTQPSEPEPRKDAESSRDFKISADIYSTERMLGLELVGGRTTNLLGRSSHLAYLDALRNFLELKAIEDFFERRHDERFDLKELQPTDYKATTRTVTLGCLTSEHKRLLLESFLINTHGMIHIFEEGSSLEDTILRINHEASQSRQSEVLQTLAMAIGWVMATEKSLQAWHFDIDAESFFQACRRSEDDWPKDLWAVQVFVMMALYSLVVVRRNAAYEYIGKAGWLAQLLGMHREELLMASEQAMQKVMHGQPLFHSKGMMRRNTWRSIIVLDRFVAVQLGRPTVVQDENATHQPECEDLDRHANSLQPAMQASSVMSTILRKIYSRSETSPGIAAKIARQDKAWPYMAPEAAEGPDGPDKRPSLSRLLISQTNSTPREQRKAVHALHNRLMQLHLVILLGRPFVLYDVYIGFRHSNNPGQKESEVLPPLPREHEDLARNCFRAAYLSISLTKKALDEGYLSQRNPFVLYYVFSAALVVVSQEIPSEHFKGSSDKYLRGDEKVPAMRKALDIFQFCAKTDPQAKHLLGLLTYLCQNCKSALSELVSRDSRAPTLGTVYPYAESILNNTNSPTMPDPGYGSPSHMSPGYSGYTAGYPSTVHDPARMHYTSQPIKRSLSHTTSMSPSSQPMSPGFPAVVPEAMHHRQHSLPAPVASMKRKLSSYGPVNSPPQSSSMEEGRSMISHGDGSLLGGMGSNSYSSATAAASPPYLHPVTAPFVNRNGSQPRLPPLPNPLPSYPPVPPLSAPSPSDQASWVGSPLRHGVSAEGISTMHSRFMPEVQVPDVEMKLD